MSAAWRLTPPPLGGQRRLWAATRESAQPASASASQTHNNLSVSHAYALFLPQRRKCHAKTYKTHTLAFASGAKLGRAWCCVSSVRLYCRAGALPFWMGWWPVRRALGPVSAGAPLYRGMKNRARCALARALMHKKRESALRHSPIHCSSERVAIFSWPFSGRGRRRPT